MPGQIEFARNSTRKFPSEDTLPLVRQGVRKLTTKRRLIELQWQHLSPCRRFSDWLKIRVSPPGVQH
jgi:hypothetical protein